MARPEVELRCPACSALLPVPFQVRVKTKLARRGSCTGAENGRISVELEFQPDMTDVYAHVWRHEAKF